jgi:hypothetical protein
VQGDEGPHFGEGGGEVDAPVGSRAGGRGGSHDSREKLASRGLRRSDEMLVRVEVVAFFGGGNFDFASRAL